MKQFEAGGTIGPHFASPWGSTCAPRMELPAYRITVISLSVKGSEAVSVVNLQRRHSSVLKAASPSTFSVEPPTSSSSRRANGPSIEEQSAQTRLKVTSMLCFCLVN